MNATGRAPESHAAAREFFDETADDYAERADARTSDLTSLIFARRRETVLELLDDSGVQGTLIDFGMGPGVFARDVVDRGFHFVGVDISPEMVERARALGLPDTTYVVGDLEALDDLRESAEAVLAVGLIDYLEDPADGLRRLAACLKPGGVLIVSFRNGRALNTGLRAVAKPVWRRLFRRSGWRAQTAFVAPVHEKPFTPRELAPLLATFGLADPVVRYHSANPLLFFNVPLNRRLWSRWLRLDRRVSRRVPRLLCDAGVLRMRKSG
jgi:SAM-dependent methyltransferase